MTAFAPHLSTFVRERLPETRGASIHTCDSYNVRQLRLRVQAVARVRLQADPQHAVGHRARSHRRATGAPVPEAPGGAAWLLDLDEERALGYDRSFMRYAELRVPSIIEQSRRVFAIPMKRTDARLVPSLAAGDGGSPSRARREQRDGIRDRAMLHLAFAAGLRATELVTLPLAAVTMTGVPCVRVIGKGRKERAPHGRAPRSASRRELPRAQADRPRHRGE